jgi:hypothetical protein
MGKETVFGSLINWENGKFVPVVELATGRTYYGGHQRWLLDEGVSKFYSDRSCGVTAITNMLIYLAQNRPEKVRLTDINTQHIKKSDYSALQKSVYNRILPAIWGVPTVTTIATRVQKFALDRGVPLKVVKYSKGWSEANVKAFIASGLNKNCPVLLLTWNSVIPDLKLHWVTVTHLYETETGTKMVTSNWGNMQTYDFTAWVNGSSFYRGVVYFE